MSHLKDMTTWIERLGRTKLRTFTNANGHFWLDQNAISHRNGVVAHSGHAVAWECDSLGGKHTGRMLVDGEVYTLAAATKKFVCKAKKVKFTILPAGAVNPDTLVIADIGSILGMGIVQSLRFEADAIERMGGTEP